MSTRGKYLVVSLFSVVTLLAIESAASAQRFLPTQRLVPINPNPEIAPGVRLQQFAYNTAVLGRAYSQIPPYLFGGTTPKNGFKPFSPGFFQPNFFNPNVQIPVLPGGGVIAGASGIGGYNPYGVNPYAVNPYAGGYGAGAVDPAAGQGGYGAPGYMPPYWNPYSGGYNYGSAMEIMAYGKVGLDQEQARILREQANQAKLDTRKKLVDTLAYIRANEYTFTQEQADIAKRLLERVQKTPTAAEVASGKSLNLLLADLTKFTDQSMRLPTVTLDEDVLKLVNICGPGSTGSIALLRNNGRFTWPSAFEDKNVATEKDRKDLELQAQQLYQQASNGPLDANTLKDLESGLGTIRSSLAKQVNAMPTNIYLDAKQFLDNFDSAVVALKKGDLAMNAEFQTKFVKGGKTLQQLVDYMGSRGFRFASAGSGDDRGYAALQAAFSAYSLALHAQVAAVPKDK